MSGPESWSGSHLIEAARVEVARVAAGEAGGRGTGPGGRDPVARTAWRAARIGPLAEVLAPGRMIGLALRLAVQVTLVVLLWRALYAGRAVSAGLTQAQAVSYAVLAVLATRVRAQSREGNRDSVAWHLFSGTIIYWFLRPIPPRRYYLYRAVGEYTYGLSWVVAGYVLCRMLGLLSPPSSAAAALAFLAAFLLGQAVFYEITLLVDLVCFWTLRNGSALTILRFAQNLLSGAYAPLWFFPGWFVLISGLLPFEATLHVPLSLYLGRIPPSAAGRFLAVQVAWIAGLAILNRRLWARAGERVAVQGG